MKINRSYRSNIIVAITFVAVMALITSCSLGGLDLQKSYKYEQGVLDPHLKMNTLEYMKSRNQPDGDSLFSIMLQAIQYTGLESKYEADGPFTYFLLTDTSFTDPNNGYLVDKGVQSITELPQDTVKALLLYHIIVGKYTSLDLKQDIPMDVQTLLDGDKGKMTLDRDDQYRIHVNSFSGSQRSVTTATTNLLPTNGVINVLDDYAAYRP